MARIARDEDRSPAQRRGGPIAVAIQLTGAIAAGELIVEYAREGREGGNAGDALRSPRWVRGTES